MINETYEGNKIINLHNKEERIITNSYGMK